MYGNCGVWDGKKSHYMTRYPVFIIIILLVHIALEEIENSGTPSNRILLGNAKTFYHHNYLSVIIDSA